MWKQIKQFPNYYINKIGDIKNKKGLILKKRSYCGYPTCMLYKNNKPYNLFNHRLVAITFLKKPKNKNIVNHKDGSRDNNNVNNLEWCTQKENIRHAMSIGRRVGRANRVHSRKLSDANIKTIWALKNNGWTQAKIGKKFGVQQSTISDIINGVTFKKE